LKVAVLVTAVGTLIDPSASIHPEMVTPVVRSPLAANSTTEAASTTA
jgi:hypothetical protein